MPVVARSIIALTALLTASGCSAGSTLPPKVSNGDLAVRLTADAPAPAPSAPYAGPLVAARALECRERTHRSHRVGYGEGIAVQGTAVDAVAEFIDTEVKGSLPSTGYRVERSQRATVLVSYDVNGRTKIAFVAADGIRDGYGRTGWGVRSYASCDPAEFPAEVTDALGIEIWQDRHGRRVPTSEISSESSRFCDAPDAGLLELHSRQGGRAHMQFVRDPSGVFRQFVAGRYDASASLPDAAADTGWHRAGKELWIGPAGGAAYLVSRADPAQVERWPAVTKRFGCG